MGRKKKNKIDGQYITIEFRLMESEAFKNLNTSTKWLYAEFKRRFYGSNRRNIIFTYKEARDIMSKDTFLKSRNKLIERGFIDIIKRGGFYNQPNIYGLSDRWKKFGTKDFIKIDVQKIGHL